ncbi:dipeptide ABC transporter ATP-binding protein [Microaerobacter geothermalis]|nr:dipeptide ABC transporter ATP-binding protein [Microaerobacter geothermalis]
MQRTVGLIKAVDGVSFSIREGETLGLVGESGCGKSTVGRTILQLYEPSEGEILFNGINITKQKTKQKQLKREMQMVFQDPFASLNPRMTIGEMIKEPLKVHHIGGKKEQEEKMYHLLEVVGLKPSYADLYPHEFSGGQRQRIGIARALALQPKLIIADEPVSALDVSIQSQIINLLQDLQKEFKLTYLFISHDLSVVKHISDHVGVMYLGKIVELAPKKNLYQNPAHPYTQALLSAVPVPKPRAKRERIILTGDIPSPANPPSGCSFHPRCPKVHERCKIELPKMFLKDEEHFVACHLYV